MNSQQAKRIPLKDLLARLGHQPHHEKSGEFWYLSPFRPETEPSFKINLERNIWFDFGEGKGGTVIDFALKYFKTSSVAAALDRLAGLDLAGRPEPVVAPAQPAATLPLFTETPAPAITVTKVEKLSNRALIGYLYGRGIPYKTAMPYVQEIHYTHQGKPYFALAFANDSGGYELRNPYFKGTHGTKDITCLGAGEGGSAQEVTVFEGFIDYLSALTHYQRSAAATPVIVLNSVAMQQRAVEAIRRMGAAKVYLYLDRDESGKKLARDFKEQLPGVEVLDKSDLYAAHKDFNEFLTAGRDVRSR